jgi:hypothetical protein
MNLVVADVSPLHLNPGGIRVGSRRLLLFRVAVRYLELWKLVTNRKIPELANFGIFLVSTLIHWSPPVNRPSRGVGTALL